MCDRNRKIAGYFPPIEAVLKAASDNIKIFFLNLLFLKVHSTPVYVLYYMNYLICIFFPPVSIVKAKGKKELKSEMNFRI